MPIELKRMSYMQEILVEMAALKWQQQLPSRESIMFFQNKGAIGLPSSFMTY